MQAHRAPSVLRSEAFKTLDRERTSKIVLAYTNTVANPEIDVRFIDAADCRQGFLGCTYHYVIGTTGRIEIGRDPHRRSSRTRQKRLHTDAIFIGCVGGLDNNGNRENTITPEQDASIEWLEQSLADAYGVPLEVTNHIETWAASRSLKSNLGMKARNQSIIDGVYAEMTDEELKASPDRITA